MHYIGIPAIVLGLLIALSWLSVTIAARWDISFAWIGMVILAIYYYFLDIKMAIVMSVILILVTLLCTWIAYPRPTSASLILFLVLFIGGWILQFIGHTFEKTKPAFLANVNSILIAPLYVVAELILALGLGKYFNLAETAKAPPLKNHRALKEIRHHGKRKINQNIKSIGWLNYLVQPTPFR